MEPPILTDRLSMILLMQDSTKKHELLMRWLSEVVFEGIPYIPQKRFSYGRRLTTTIRLIAEGVVCHPFMRDTTGPRIIVQTCKVNTRSNTDTGKWFFFICFQFPDQPDTCVSLRRAKIETLERYGSILRLFIHTGNTDTYELLTSIFL